HQELLQYLFAAAAFLVAFGYAFAESGRPDPVRAGASVLAAALDGLDVRWVVLSAPATTAAIAGAALAAAGVRARGVARSVVMHLAGAALLAGAAVAGTFLLDRLVDPAQWRAAPAVVGRATAGDLSTWLLRRLGPTIACVLAVVASFHHVAAVLVGLQGRREDGARPDLGARLGRDLLLVASATAGVAFVLAGRAPGALSPARTAIATGFGAIVVATATAAHAAFRERSARHVYFVQLALVATYALFRNELAPGLPPEADATFALVLGFLLLGATVQARRADIPEIAASTRTFAALLPIAVAVFMPHRASMSAALAAAASAALYGALGWVERSRWLGTLGVAAINLALLLVARTGGLQGREFDLAAIGLFILAVGHLFTTKMEHGARVAVRVVGGLFLYSPAALRLATQLGDAPSGAYSVGFGAACLLGVLAGMVLHIRAYLAFGTLFLVLDVVANLAAAGLRDHRIGFLVLSVTGLSILAIMVVVTLKRDRVRALSARLRASLRGWD
ncbi:MAG: hypothetical protein HYV09_19255, partial [Deltaproteobacteria bacterium]|nr:hypothetical protein [Deltaproteobacteria bacterium]